MLSDRIGSLSSPDNDEKPALRPAGFAMEENGPPPLEARAEKADDRPTVTAKPARRRLALPGSPLPYGAIFAASAATEKSTQRAMSPNLALG